MARFGFIQDELDLKMLVLYLMSRVAAPIEFNQLLDLALCDAGVDYFSLTQAVDELVKSGHLARGDAPYSITPAGLRDSEICQSSLPYSVRRRCDENLAKLNAVLQRRRQVQGDLTPNPDGTCTVRLLLHDDSGELMDLRILHPSAQAGEAVLSRFEQTPERFYQAVMEALEKSSAAEENTIAVEESI